MSTGTLGKEARCLLRFKGELSLQREIFEKRIVGGESTMKAHASLIAHSRGLSDLVSCESANKMSLVIASCTHIVASIAGACCS